MKKFLIIFILLITISSRAVALEEDAPKQNAFSMTDCINYAMEHRNDVVIAKEKVEVQKSKVGQAKSAYFPTLGLTNGYTFTGNASNRNGSGVGGSSMAGSSTNTSNSYGLNAKVNQFIWDFGKTTAKINMNKYNLQSSAYDLQNVVLDATYAVKVAYYSVLAAKAAVDISYQTVMINRLNYDRTKALFDEGLKSKIDVTNAEVNYTTSKIQLLESEQSYKETLIALSKTMNYLNKIDFEVKPVENFNFKPIEYKPFSISTSYIKNLQNGGNSETILTSGIEKHNILFEFAFKPCETTEADAFDKAVLNRPDLKSLELVAKASEESLKTLKRSYYPSINANAGYSYGLNSVNSNNNFQVYAGLDFPTVNIMDIKTKIDEGKALLAIAEENYKLSKNNIYYEISGKYVAMKQLEAKIPLMSQKVSQTLENFELADGRYTVGLGNFIELQDALLRYNNAQLEFVETIFKYNVAREEFSKAMGVL